MSSNTWNGIEKENEKKIVETLPIRIADYFLTIGPGKLISKTTDLKYDNIDQLTFNPIIINCYPDPQTMPDTPLPELVGPFAFPLGLTLSTVEKLPYCFTFVLTDVNRVKLYGTTLIVYELLEPEQLSKLLNGTLHSNAKNNRSYRDLKNNSKDVKNNLKSKSAESIHNNNNSSNNNSNFEINQNTVVYAPKAITILSHYGFFNLFSKFLEELYHVSLSTPSIPIERFVFNFMHELPLPPQGFFPFIIFY
jgi:hypothetical protein